MYTELFMWRYINVQADQRRRSVTISDGGGGGHKFFSQKVKKKKFKKKKRSQRCKRNIRQYVHMYGSINI